MKTVRGQLHVKLQILIEKLKISFVEPNEIYEYGYGPMTGSTGGFWEPSRDFMCVRNALPFPFNLAGCMSRHTGDNFLMHEVIHWTGHPSRLNRPAIAEYFKVSHISQVPEILLHTEEAIAELGMLRLAAALGFDIEPIIKGATYYISTYPKADLLMAEKYAREAVDYILKAGYVELTNYKKSA